MYDEDIKDSALSLNCSFKIDRTEITSDGQEEDLKKAIEFLYGFNEGFVSMKNEEGHTINTSTRLIEFPRYNDKHLVFSISKYWIDKLSSIPFEPNENRG